MSDKNLKPTNLVQLTGRIRVKRYDEEKKELFMVISVSTPKTAMASRGGDDEWNRDYPAFVAEGEMAERIDREFEEGDWIATFGRMDTRQTLRYEGNRTYKETWEPIIVLDAALRHEGRIDSNVVVLCGDVIRVYRNPDRGKRFYMITMRIPNPDGTNARATVTYFDPNMKFEPKPGDRVFAAGKVQTKREQSSDGDRRKTRFVTSVVTRSAAIERARQDENGRQG